MKKFLWGVLLVVFVVGSILPLYGASQKTIIIKIGSIVALVDNQAVTMDVAPFIYNSRTFVPLRFVSEQLGAKVEYSSKPDGTTNQVFITMADYSDPSMSPSPSTPPAGSLAILSHNSHYDSAGDFWIAGEVQNQTGKTVTSVKVLATLYNSSNEVVATEFTYTDPDTIIPDEIALFKILVMDPPFNLDHYSLSVD